MTYVISIRFLCELINQGKRLIFTGNQIDCSMSNGIIIGYGINGGMLAWSVLYKLWTLPYFSADILHNNVAAIVFHSSSWIIGSVVEDASSESVHSIYVLADFTYDFGMVTFETVSWNSLHFLMLYIIYRYWTNIKMMNLLH